MRFDTRCHIDSSRGVLCTDAEIEAELWRTYVPSKSERKRAIKRAMAGKLKRYRSELNRIRARRCYRKNYGQGGRKWAKQSPLPPDTGETCEGTCAGNRGPRRKGKGDRQ
jgi:hypothetical protein